MPNVELNPRTAVKILKNVATGTSNVISLREPKSEFTLQVIAGTGVSAGVVSLEGSLDAANWFPTALVATPSLTAPGQYAVHVTGKPCLYIRIRITTPVVGGTISAMAVAV